tara:strand:- start:605 stop:1228 length:624 start_codon:yes stop_codon:yes gene_type:complete
LKVVVGLLLVVLTLSAGAEEFERDSSSIDLRKNKDVLKLKLALDSLSKINIPERSGCNERLVNSMPFIDVKLVEDKNILSELKLPKKIGGELKLLDNPGLNDVIKVGFWSNNFTTWNILKVDLYTARKERFKTDIKVDTGSASTEMKYTFDLGETNTIELKAYNRFSHDMFKLKNIESGGRVGYGFKYGKLNFGFYLFAAHHQSLEN